LTNRTKEDSKIYSKLEDDEEEDVDLDSGSGSEEGVEEHQRHVVHPNNDYEDLGRDRDDSMDSNIDPRRRLMLMTEKAPSLQ
jgi:hypothetical protein